MNLRLWGVAGCVPILLGRRCCDYRMHVPLFCCGQMGRQPLFQQGQAELGTRNNMGNWEGSSQNVNVHDMVILKRRCGEARCLTDPERSLEMTLHSIWPCA